jgi:hypothetical protein
VGKSKKEYSHAKLLKDLGTAADGDTSGVLGNARAVVIVTACANTSPLNLSRTLSELGVDGIAFQGCVFNGVSRAGFSIELDDIPDSDDTTLVDAVGEIQDAPQKGAAKK